MDKTFQGRLLIPQDAGESKVSLATDEAKKVKLCIGALRGLWRSTCKLSKIKIFLSIGTVCYLGDDVSIPFWRIYPNIWFVQQRHEVPMVAILASQRWKVTYSLRLHAERLRGLGPWFTKSGSVLDLKDPLQVFCSMNLMWPSSNMILSRPIIVKQFGNRLSFLFRQPNQRTQNTKKKKKMTNPILKAMMVTARVMSREVTTRVMGWRVPRTVSHRTWSRQVIRVRMDQGQVMKGSLDLVHMLMMLSPNAIAKKLWFFLDETSMKWMTKTPWRLMTANPTQLLPNQSLLIPTLRASTLPTARFHGMRSSLQHLGLETQGHVALKSLRCAWRWCSTLEPTIRTLWSSSFDIGRKKHVTLYMLILFPV